ncbi:hypothetical protein NHF50_00460 [Flavobacterium sp. NRK F10]|uniref:hypothetical protein n=1 Tax=Flavobacterium sp. NRK F10 TaxID=2954931 RepID=UPI002091BE98|nr:hypothetical protein [Flavobacterium sp. NRK F10]MCO6173507.1 hypothetical protein [Flavobacterium sp. NRK F10]
MKIAKYIILLLALLGVAFVVFITTQPKHFSVTTSFTVNHPKDSVSQFVSDGSKWKSWFNRFESNTENTFTTENDSFKWINENTKGSFSLAKRYQNDSLVQKMNYNGIQGTSKWDFTPNSDSQKTDISWHISGDLSFRWKVVALLNGGIENFFRNKQQNALQEINKQIVDAILFHQVSVTGIITKHETNYVFKKDSVALSDFQKAFSKSKVEVSLFVKQNNIETNGQPFVLVYQNSKYNRFATCYPVTEEIITTTNSKIDAAKLNEFQALKVTFKGNPSFKNEVFTKAKEYLEKNQYTFDEKEFKWLEIHKEEINSKGTVSETIEYYFPVKRKHIPVVSLQDSVQNNTSDQTEIVTTSDSL